MGEKEVFFGDFLSPDKKLPASRRIAEALIYRTSNKPQAPPSPQPSPASGRGGRSKAGFQLRRNDEREKSRWIPAFAGMTIKRKRWISASLE
jgi:hypothetical protein